MIRRWLMLLLSPCAFAAPTDFKLVSPAPAIRSPEVTEASGAACAISDPKCLWVINDSGAEPIVHLMGIDGTARGKVRVADAQNIDWEDIDSFTLDDRDYLLISDTGDNDSKRASRTLYVIREPKVPADGKLLDGSVSLAWRIDFRYEDGPRDCEAVAVDPKREEIILVSKRTQPPMIYKLPLRAPKNEGMQVAKRIGTCPVAAPANSATPYPTQPTGLDITRDGSLAALLTYHAVLLYPRAKDEDWAAALNRAPITLSAHHLRQAEGIAFMDDGKTIVVVSEGRESTMAIYRREP